MSDSPSADPVAGPRSPWPLGLLVVGAMGLLHLGVGLVLTRSARGDVASVEQAWSPLELAEAQAPDARPEGTGAEFAAWTRAQRLWDDAQRRTERRAQVRALTLALGASFALQAGFVGWLALRASRSRRRR
jgi:hypothetical protein